MEIPFWTLFCVQNLVNLAISIVNLPTGFLLILILRKYDLFHVNFRMILSNFYICLTLNNFVQIFRPILVLHFLSSPASLELPEYRNVASFAITGDKNDDLDCVLFSPLPVIFCLFLAISGIFLCIERLYATYNYAKYEHEYYREFLDKIFTFLWAIISIYVFVHLLTELFSKSVNAKNFLQCSLTEALKNPMKSQWHLAILLLCYSMFIFIFYIVLKANYERQESYVKDHYASLSPRFQISENIKVMRLLMRTIPFFFVGILSILTLSFLTFRWQKQLSSEQFNSLNVVENSDHSQIFQTILLVQESSFLILHVCTFLSVYRTLNSTPSFKYKRNLILGRLIEQLRSTVRARLLYSKK